MDSKTIQCKFTPIQPLWTRNVGYTLLTEQCNKHMQENLSLKNTMSTKLLKKKKKRFYFTSLINLRESIETHTKYIQIKKAQKRKSNQVYKNLTKRLDKPTKELTSTCKFQTKTKSETLICVIFSCT